MGAPQSSLVWPPRLSRALDRAWTAGICKRPLLNPDAIIAHAVKREGASPADGAWRERLDWLCVSLRDEARPSSLGTTIAYGQLVRIVAARIRAERLWRDHPEILERPLAAPIAIVGQMRSGTTRAHRLLACADGLAHTRMFESLEPIPYRGWRRAIDTRPLAAAAGVAFLNFCNPALARIHPTTPFAPEEEFGLHAFSLWGAQFEGQWHVPGYARHCEQAGPADVYDEFARLLQTIGWSRGDDPRRRWLIKAPQFCQDLGALIARFTDINIIYLTRCIDDVVASGASLAWHQARIQSDHADRTAIGAEWLRKTILRGHRMDQAFAHRPPSITLEFEEISGNWQGCIDRAAVAVSLTISAAARRQMEKVQSSAAGHLGHRYALADFGLDHSMYGTRTVNPRRPLPS